MALFDIFKKKEAEKKPEKKATGEFGIEKKPKRKAETKIEKPKTEKKDEAKKRKAETGAKPKKALKGTDAWKSLFSPHVTEKATDLTGGNQYVFKVFKKTNKNEIKRAVQSLYDVDVEQVRIVNVRRKKRRIGRTQGFKKGYKKAIVKIKKGQEIEVLPR